MQNRIITLSTSPHCDALSAKQEKSFAAAKSRQLHLRIKTLIQARTQLPTNRPESFKFGFQIGSSAHWMRYSQLQLRWFRPESGARRRVVKARATSRDGLCLSTTVSGTVTVIQPEFQFGLSRH